MITLLLSFGLKETIFFLGKCTAFAERIFWKVHLNFNFSFSFLSSVSSDEFIYPQYSLSVSVPKSIKSFFII